MYARSLMTIVGVVANLRTLGLETDPDPEVFTPVAQAGLQTQYSFFVVGRTTGDPLTEGRAFEATIHGLDKSLPVAGLQSMETRLGNSMSQRRFSLFLLSLFAGLALFLAVVCVALLSNGVFEIWFSYQESKEALVALQREKALGAAARIEQFVTEVERQISWTTQPSIVAPSAAMEQRRADYFRLLRQEPPITEVSYLDAEGREQLRVSRLAMDVIASGTDFSQEPRFREPKAGRTYFSLVYFRKESEPYMTIAAARAATTVSNSMASTNSGCCAVGTAPRSRDLANGKSLTGTMRSTITLPFFRKENVGVRHVDWNIGKMADDTQRVRNVLCWCEGTHTGFAMPREPTRMRYAR